ncbi:hypothetical protein GCM10017056_47170 [Seohaeicola zhoushanensis]|uniref:Uncharacterized protein n=1 Tax=Seohaeicola zhoushanensis TaxID=1569283 RepID=A0A8J3M9V5_9RHOB|nr:hypothetical protein GCM10017056_47170 [Seohaeicola zhoushanensis]
MSRPMLSVPIGFVQEGGARLDGVSDCGSYGAINGASRAIKTMSNRMAPPVAPWRVLAIARNVPQMLWAVSES